MQPLQKQSGLLSIHMLILGTVSIILMVGFILWADSFSRQVTRAVDDAQAFTIAEAGVEYYRWHLAHGQEDFTDGTGGPGPYIHAYYDKDGNRIGEFELEITPPTNGTTIVTINSIGRIDSAPGLEREIRVLMGLPSLARFSAAANADIRFGEGTIVYGQLHSNGGVRFDGEAFNIVSSAKEDYNDPDHSGGNEFGVHTHVFPTDPLPPAAVPVRSDVFRVGRSFPVPLVDFGGFTQDLADIKAEAQSPDGYYRGASGRQGWEVVLKTDDTFDLYQIRRVYGPPSGCSSSQSGWGTWSVRTRSLTASNVPFPANGVMFFEDHLWVRGQIDTARLMIAAGAFPVNPSTYKSITINSDLTYTNKDGQDVLGLIAQNNMNVGLYSEDDLEIDAALVAQNGRVGRYYYNYNCGSNYVRQQISLFGMIATNQRYGWAYTDGTGYQTRVITYDGNLLYSPPPSFPITASQYDILSWEEVE